MTYVSSISSRTIWPFGLDFVNSTFRTRLCRSNELSSSPAGIVKVSALITQGLFAFRVTVGKCATGFLGFFTLRRSLNRFFKPTVIAPYNIEEYDKL